MSKTDNQTAQDLAAEIEALRERQDRLEEENEQLKEQNEQLQQQVQEVQNSGLSVPKPSRRSFLKAGGASLAALAFGSAATGSAAAAGFDDSDPTIGGPSNRYDMYFDALDANTVNTEDATITDGELATSAQYNEWDTRTGTPFDVINAGNTIEITGDGSNQPILEPRPRFAYVIVGGFVGNDPATAFTDLLLITSLTEVKIVESDTRGTVAVRSYSDIGNNKIGINIDEGGDTIQLGLDINKISD